MKSTYNQSLPQIVSCLFGVSLFTSAWGEAPEHSVSNFESIEMLCELHQSNTQKSLIKKLPPETITYIKSKYEHTLFTKEHLFYPAKKAKKLIILFNGANKNRYMMFSWFWNDKEMWRDTAYLFLKDDDYCWYLGNNEKDFVQDYSNIINHYIKVCKLTPDQVFTVGSSMGAYASIFYATMLGLKGVIALNPQVNKMANEATRYSIKNAGRRWQDLDKMLALHTKVPNISLIFAYDPRDEAAGYALIDELKKKSPMLLIRRHPASMHGIANLVFSKEFVESEINYLEKSTQFMETKSLIFDDDDI